MHFQQITLIGVGLLGGSLGLAIKERRLAEKVIGFVRRTATVAECQRLNVVDQVTRDLHVAVAASDLVVLCTPIGEMSDLTEQMLPDLKKNSIVTDVGSVKASVVQSLEPLVGSAGAHYVGSHPMAGAEKAGVGAARADLFENAVCVITPTAHSHPEAVQRLEEFWSALGTRTLKLTPDLHDDLVSRSSHLPHVVAAELANYVLSPAHPKEQALLCAHGFKDTTRIASGSPAMWRDIALANRKYLARVLGVFVEDLQEFQFALQNEDRKAIEEFFENARQRREQWCGSDVSPSPE